MHFSSFLKGSQLPKIVSESVFNINDKYPQFPGSVPKLPEWKSVGVEGLIQENHKRVTIQRGGGSNLGKCQGKTPSSIACNCFSIASFFNSYLWRQPWWRQHFAKSAVHVTSRTKYFRISQNISGKGMSQCLSSYLLS